MPHENDWKLQMQIKNAIVMCIFFCQFHGSQSINGCMSSGGIRQQKNSLNLSLELADSAQVGLRLLTFTNGGSFVNS